MSDWFENDTLWERLEGFLFSHFRSDEITESEARQIMELVPLPPGVAVLDLCCGPGRHTLKFARRGFQVTGVDRTTQYIEAARTAAMREGLRVDLVQDDMRRFHRPDAFALALNLFSSFGYFAEAGEDLQVLRNLHASLQPGGTLLLEMAGKEQVVRDFQPRTWHIRLYSGAELRRLLFEAGFTAVQLYGSLEGTPYDQTAWRLVAIATN